MESLLDRNDVTIFECLWSGIMSMSEGRRSVLVIRRLCICGTHLKEATGRFDRLKSDCMLRNNGKQGFWDSRKERCWFVKCLENHAMEFRFDVQWWATIACFCTGDPKNETCLRTTFRLPLIRQNEMVSLKISWRDYLVKIAPENELILIRKAMALKN